MHYRTACLKFEKQKTDLQAAYESVGKEAAKERGFHTWMRRYFAGHTLHIAQEPIMPVAECRLLRVLSFRFEFASGPPVQAKRDHAKAFYAETVGISGTNHLSPNDEAYLNGMAYAHNLGAISVADLIIRERLGD